MKILFVNIPVQSHIIPTLGIVEKLVKNGHQVDYINSTCFQDLIENSGAKLIPYVYFPDAKKNIDLWMYKVSYDTAIKIGKEYDLILYEMADFIGQVLGEHLNKPTVRICSQFAFNNHVKNKLINSNTKYIPFRKKKLARIWTKMFLSLNVRFTYNDYYDEITNNISKLNIVLTSKTFQYQGDKFNNDFKFVGPIIYNRHEHYDNEIINLKNNNKQIIYISLGSISSSMKFIKKCIDAFANKDVCVIISLGNKTKFNSLENLPKNIFLFDWAPQLEILSKASLFISHAGMNSVNESLYFGVPLVVSPITNDQYIIADRIQELNLGTKIDMNTISSEDLYTISKETMNNQKINENLIKMKYEMQNAGGADLAVYNIEKFHKKFIGD